MRTRTGAIGVVLLLAFAGSSPATEWFVATNGNDAAAGTSWATAKLTIQAGINEAASSDTIWVSNGVYATGGGRAVVGTWPNRVAIDRAVTVASVNGPETTFIVGAGMRCAYVTNGATLSGFMLTNGITASFNLEGEAYTNVDYKGGGAFCEDSAILSNCVLTGNWAYYSGGGSRGGVLNNCLLVGNSTWELGGGSDGGVLNQCILTENHADMAGGGAEGGTLNDCVLASNTTSYGGGAINSTLNRCRIQNNYGGSEGGGVFGGTLNQCVVSGNRSMMGGGAARDAILNECLVVSNVATEEYMEDMRGGGGARQCRLYNCTVAGNTAVGEGGGIFLSAATNCIVVDNYSSMGLGSNYRDSTLGYSCTTPDPGGTGNLLGDPRFVDAAAGNYRLSAGSPCINAGDNAAAPGGTDLDGNPRIIFGTVDMGAYEFLYQHVAPGGSDGASGISWATAKQTIQAAVDAATNGCTVWVSNGTYATGGRIVYMDGGLPSSSNRVVIDKPLTVRSVNGPDVTIIQGEKDPASTNGFGDAAVRCAFVETGAVLSGFTLTNGATATNGAGAFRTYGGGVVGRGIVENCTLVGNSAWANGGGAYYSALTLNNCKVIENSAGEYGGGAHSATLNNCTVAGNSAGGAGGGCYQATLRNCIAFSNTAIYGSNYEYCTVQTSCTTPYPGWPGNIAIDPQFVDAAAGDYRLQATSPCLDAGDDGVVSWAEDLDGNPRIAFGAVDMGAYEAQLAGAGTWFGAIVNGQTGDLDCVAGDGVPNLLKYATGGSPRISDDNALLECLPAGTRPTLTFHRNPSATDVRYVVEGAETISKGAAWRGLATNVGGSWLGATNVSESATGNPVECTVTDPVALQSNRFLRLRVTRP